MGSWKRTLNIKDDWELAENDHITVHEFVKRLIPKLELLNDKRDDEELDDLIDRFDDFIKDPENTEDDFDNIWDELYDWADANRVWIKTF